MGGAGAVPRPRPVRASAVGRLGVAATAALALAGCSLAGGPEPVAPPSSPSAASSPDAPSSPSATAEPRLVVDDGFVTLSTLPEPIASVGHELPASIVPRTAPGTVVRQRADLVRLERSGDVVRAVVAVLVEPDAQGAAADGFYSTMSRAISDYEPGWQLYDPQAATAADPLRDGEDCLCTHSVAATREGRVNLFWADFPAPAHDSFTLVLGREYPPMEDLRVPRRTARLPEPGDLLDYTRNEPPATPGQGADAPVVHAVVARSETLSGVITTTSGDDQQLALPSDVLFALDSATVEPDAGAELDAAAAAVAAAAGSGQVVVTGHTDDQGQQAYNQDLSLRRARAVAERVGPVMVAAGTTLDVRGAGEDQPLVPNTTEKGDAIAQNQARNRRVAFSWRGAGPTTPVGGTSPVRPVLPAAVPAPAPAPAGSIASALSTSTYSILTRERLIDGRDPMRLDVRSARREGDRLRVDLTMAALTGRQVWAAGRPRMPADDPGFAATSLIGSALVDPATGVAGHALVDDAGRCLCSRSVGNSSLLLGETYHFWAYYPAPPAGASTVDLEVGSFGRLEGVPVS